MAKVIKHLNTDSTAASAVTFRIQSSPAEQQRANPTYPRIVARDILNASQEADEIIANAQEAATQIIQQAHSQVRTAKQQGFENGLSAGRAAYTKQLVETSKKLRLLEDQLETDYIRLVCVCVEKILHREIIQTPETIVDIVRSTLADVRQHREIVVRAHPDDLNILKTNRSRLTEVITQCSSIHLRDDPELKRGDCVIITEIGTITATLEEQLDTLANILNTSR
ncbi:MAG: type III secretion system stator protein SctL [Myxococcales bacterium]|nr:type III secretion system stator protein SctL [Myxococcales bacterium]